MGPVLINNQRNSPFGAGWTLEGLGRLTRKNDNTLLTEGDGSVIHNSVEITMNIYQRVLPNAAAKMGAILF